MRQQERDVAMAVRRTGVIRHDQVMVRTCVAGGGGCTEIWKEIM